MAGPPVSTVAPQWPDRLLEVCGELRSACCPAAREAARAEGWLLLNGALSSYLRWHSTRLGRVDRADLEDIAAAKSLDLLRRAESGTWDLSGRAGSDLPGFLSTVARNGLIDLLRASGRQVPLPDDLGSGAESDGRPLEATMPGSPTSEDPGRGVECREFSQALLECAERLEPRSRLIWFFRVFYDLSSKEISGHPEVSLKPGHVDVILQRTREAVGKCMTTKGHRPTDMPPGTFAELWSALQLPAAPAMRSRP